MGYYLNGEYIGDLGLPIRERACVPKDWVAGPKNYNRSDLEHGWVQTTL